MKRRIGLMTLLCVVMLFSASAALIQAAEKGDNASASQERPNIIIFVADDAGWTDFGAYGHPTIRTPNVDQLARQGMKFTRAFLTTSSCSPSRASILTGRYPHNTGAATLHEPLPSEQTMLTVPLNKAGYYTVSAGKWHLGGMVKDQFDKVVGYGNASGAGHWLDVLRKRPKDRPFFAWLAAGDPHRGYGPNAIENPYEAEDAVVPPYLPDVPIVRKDLANYYDEITRFDHNVGKVLDYLDKHGLTDETVVMLITDNGRPFPRCKTMLYDSGIKTPLIVRWPGHVEPGSVTNSLVSSVDIAPTVLEIAGLEPLESFQGRSFLPILKNPEATIRKYAFAEHNWHDYKAYERAVRSKRYLYIRNWLPQLPHTPPADAVNSPTYNVMRRMYKRGELTPAQRHVFVAPRPAHELYDTWKDPYQLNNLVDNPKYADVLKRMKSALKRWRERTDDQMPEDLRDDIFDRMTGERL